ncbi:hypothetical protein [Pseudomonas sp. WS 5410]|jgi:hypothetical protein|uniref:hypothetical protein n=1 Tax=Pseudomonas sp. WS 5410 TaxID=2717485 RepID=UPI001473E47E|nr:hypothetical protein [Pseudomonas sp. WS 5410]NMY23522.1 hypothetical protein [Pseudomonas sp. WS 5410]
MSEVGLIFIILTAWATGTQLGYAFGYHRAFKRLIPELNAEREEVAKLKLLARLRGDQ